MTELSARPHLQPISGPGVRPLVTFAAIGAATTVLHLGLFGGLRLGLPAQSANLVALALATVANTAANRRWTFGLRGSTDATRHQVQGFTIFLLTWALTAAGLGWLHSVDPHPATWLEVLAVATVTLGSTAVKYVIMRMWVFRARN